MIAGVGFIMRILPQYNQFIGIKLSMPIATKYAYYEILCSFDILLHIMIASHRASPSQFQLPHSSQIDTLEYSQFHAVV